mmetsp:Transcript_7298/g.18129  ORF Transcript_7298/g.18129 Transcript_7298/m.18129 type:complete len:253 (-) Transcript_7298:82-840(-)
MQVKLMDIGKIPLHRNKLVKSRLDFHTGKNVHVFEGSDNRTYVECWPFDNHTYREVNFLTGHTIASLEDMPRLYDHPAVNPAIVTTPDAATAASFPNSVRNAVVEGARGTSGLVDLTLAGKPVKVGISHSVPPRRQYLSRFYAFLPKPPFPIVAYSGFFCLGGLLRGDAGWADLWVTALPLPDHLLALGGETFACPKITFASGFTEYIGRGGNYAIISYGADDCYSRSIVVHKKRIERLLLGRRKRNNHTGD